jgi:hypothetical protein
MSDSVSRWVQTAGHRMNCRQRRHISTVYLAHTRARRSAVEDAASTKQRRDKIVTITGSSFINRYLHEPLGFHVTAPVLTRVDHGSTIHLPVVIHVE